MRISSVPFAKCAIKFAGVNSSERYSPSEPFNDATMSSILLAGYSARKVALNHAGSAWPVRNIVSIRLVAISMGDAGEGVAVAAGAGAATKTGIADINNVTQTVTKYLTH